MLIDTHMHLGDERFDEDRDAVFDRARAAGVCGMIEIADRPEEWERALSLCRMRPDSVRCTLGLHPYYADQWSPDLGERLKKLAPLPEVVGAGEIGLDYFKHCSVPRPQQAEAFRGMLSAAWASSLPVVVHCRDANDDLVEILENFYANKQRKPGTRYFGVVHCFSGNSEHARRLTALRFALGVDGPITYPKNDGLRDAVRDAGLDAVVLETDSPWLPPQSRRGKRNEPGAIDEIAGGLAEAFGVTKNEIASATSRNARDLFAWPE